ncbi:hypothetical protein EPJ78_08270 [Brachyspira aalborgi]|uniref:Uncharacterized protein n=1 Tax=Brachyspira aalborgi TaxID=29522 RepID=A0A5C8ED42_9SPIR|nr:hypothetical protein EPJ78_08270 [Brachyspira aalborgi]
MRTNLKKKLGELKINNYLSLRDLFYKSRLKPAFGEQSKLNRLLRL